MMKIMTIITFIDEYYANYGLDHISNDNDYDNDQGDDVDELDDEH